MTNTNEETAVMKLSAEQTAERTQSTVKPIVWFSDEGSSNVARLGGKNASLGEMTTKMRQRGIPVPPGFAVTADAYWSFIDANRLRPAIAAKLAYLFGAGGEPDFLRLDVRWLWDILPLCKIGSLKEASDQ
jgi:Pyruvate phosphate dikinase, AMP/ATP-binding domain